ncbi:MAG: LPS-assembly protein LptD [Bacteroidetes bacterium]|nr:LPS-assembly protein LptD [Bacteroidota bacterium]
MPVSRKNKYKFKGNRRNIVSILSICMLFLNSLTSAQVVNDTLLQDTLTISTNTFVKDSLLISKDKLDFPVNYQAKDSIVYNAKQKQLYLFTEAEISYDEVKVNADIIRYNQDSTTLHAIEWKEGKQDSAQKSRITQGQESSTFTSLSYHFKSKRAIIENAYSQYGEGFIFSEQVKRNSNEAISGYRNVYTTCNDEHPHFGIAARKIKIVPNRVAVTGSANLVIEDIPTPLYLPFGMFPLQKGQRSGFKLPTYDMSEQLGFGLRELGYYFAINDHVDLLMTSDIYAFGTYRVGFNSNYVYRYRFNGGLAFNYSYTKIGEPYEQGSQQFKGYSINWNHSINQNVMPGSSFSASVNIINNRSYQIYNTYDANLYLNNNYSSNISYSKSWVGKPYNFTAALRHNQNTQTHSVQVTLPEIAFTVSQVFPLQVRKNIIKPRWYEKIGMSYQFNASNSIQFNDSTFRLSTLRFSDFQNGFKHYIPVSASYLLLKYINLTTAVNYTERWHTQRNFKQYNFDVNQLDTFTTNGFFASRFFDASATLSTRIYGVKVFKQGAIRGIRHVLTPSVSLSYHPDFGSGITQYYYNTFSDSNFTQSRYSYYDGSIYGVPPDGRFGGINFALGNTLQMKVRSKKDTLTGTKKVRLIDGLDFSGSYNLAVDSFRLSNLAVRYRTSLMENINISGSVLYDPYAIDKASGKRVKETYYKTTGKLLRFRSADLAIRASLPLKKNNSALKKADEMQLQTLQNNYAKYADFNIPWTLDFNYGVSLTKNYLVESQKDTLQFNQNLNFSGDVNLTEKWKIGLSSGYDFRQKEITYTSFNIFRDLHCWEMRLNLIPFGQRKSYNFALNVKSTVLQDLKLVRRKDFRDNL